MLQLVPSSSGLGYRALIPATGVRIPSGLLVATGLKLAPTS